MKYFIVDVNICVVCACVFIRLKEYPQYCQFLASIPHFGEFPPNLKEVCSRRHIEFMYSSYSYRWNLYLSWTFFAVNILLHILSD